MSERTGVIAWIDREQESLLRDVLTAGQLRLTALGSPQSGATRRLLDETGAIQLTDLRVAIGERVDRESDDILLLASSTHIDADLRRLISGLSLRTFVIEPQFGSVTEMSDDPLLARLPTFVPLARRCAGYRAATEAMRQFGQAQCVNVFFRGGLGHGTLTARLFDAMDVVLDLCGPIEAVNAALSGPLQNVPDELHDLRGHMTINIRFKPNRCACAALSDSAGGWFRGITVLGDGGCMRISETGFEWIGPDGTMIDQLHEPPQRTPGGQIGLQIRRVLDGKDHSQSPPDCLTLVTLCEAARLSCLTGQDETPAKLKAMLARP